MARARETAAAIATACALDIRFDDRLRELGNNRLDHTPWPRGPVTYVDLSLRQFVVLPPE